MFRIKTFEPPSPQVKRDLCRKFNLSCSETFGYQCISANLSSPLTIHHIRGDGNCLFRALAFMISGDEDQHFKIREIIVNSIEFDRSVQQSGVLGCDPSIYLTSTQMKEDGTWGTDVELMVASAVFNIPIYTYTLYGGQFKWLEFLPSEITRDFSQTYSCALYIKHTSLCHYDVVTSVTPKTEMDGQEEAAQVDTFQITISDMDNSDSNLKDVLGMSLDIDHNSDELGISLENMDSDSNVFEKSVDELGISIGSLDVSETFDNHDHLQLFSEKDEDFISAGCSFIVENDAILTTENRLQEDPYDFDIEYEDTLFIPSAIRQTSTPRKVKTLKMSQEKDVFTKKQIVESNDSREDHNLSFLSDTSLKDPACIPTKKLYLKGKSPKLLQKAIKYARAAVVKLKGCNCIQDITEEEIKKYRSRFWTKSIEQRIEWFLDKVSEVKIKHGCTFYNIDDGKRVCGFCFRTLYKINKNFYYKYLKKGRRGDIAAGMINRRKMGNTTSETISWIEDYSSNRADQMPNNQDLMLPCGTRKIGIYEQYVAERTENLRYSVSRSAFYKLWTDRFPNLKIKQVNSFSKCTTCVYIERELQKTRDPAQRAYFKKLMTVHNERQMTERRYYYEKREQAKLNPSKYMSVIIDGMDQAKTNLPHFTGRLHKGIDPSSLLKTHIQGVINHGLHTFSTYVDLCEYSHDANLVMNVLLRSINAAISKDGKLPEILFIQADNCARENKNKYILGFCELLVMLSVFKEVHLSFLYVGHTHEDIDAAFSKISTTLRSTNVETIPKLLLSLGAIQIQGVFDVKSWLLPYLKDMKHHSKPLHFKFSRDSLNKTCLSYRANSTKVWARLEESILTGIPAGKPMVLIPPNFGKMDVDGIKANIEKSRCIMSEESQYKWWCGFLAELKELQQSERKQKQYAEKGAIWLLPKLQNKANLHKDKIQEISKSAHIEALMDKDFDDPIVTVQSKGRGKHKKK